MTKIIIGTVRGRSGGTHTVVVADGSRVDMILEGDVVPPIGGDVIGTIDESGPIPRMKLVPNVANLLLQGRCLISASGRPDVTARMLARALSGADSAFVRPGTGGIIERTPTVGDPDLSIALRAFAPAAKSLGLALNVIDPLALAGAEWSEQSLKDDLLPADAVGDKRGLTDLRRLMRNGFTPACRRTMEEFTRGRSVSSVDFVLPYSPFSSGISFSNSIGGAYRSEVVRHYIPPRDARRLSSYREIALAFAHRHLGRTKEIPGSTRHVEDSFADAAAAILFIRDGGSPTSLEKFTKLREAALARWDGVGDAPPATHTTLAQISRGIAHYAGATINQILSDAASAALSNAPRTARALAAIAESSSCEGAYIDLETCSAGTTKAIKRAYQRDIDDTLAHVGGSPNAMERFVNFSIITMPSGLGDVFDACVERYGGSPDTGLAVRDAAVIGSMFEDAFHIPECEDENEYTLSI